MTLMKSVAYIFLMRKLRIRETKYLIQVHRVSKYLSQDIKGCYLNISYSKQPAIFFC